jgi:hypothetical protein
MRKILSGLLPSPESYRSYSTIILRADHTSFLPLSNISLRLDFNSAANLPQSPQASFFQWFRRVCSDFYGARGVKISCPGVAGSAAIQLEVRGASKMNRYAVGSSSELDWGLCACS